MALGDNFGTFFLPGDGLETLSGANFGAGDDLETYFGRFSAIGDDFATIWEVLAMIVAKAGEILDELSLIELSKGVRVVFACESGSREWGFASESSDYDVRFVYVRPMGDYLRLEKLKDVIEWSGHDEIDVVGWDLRKFLRLMRNSNPSTIEWLGSTTVYREDAAFLRVRGLRNECFSPSASAWHYYGMAKKHDLHYLKDDMVRVKKYLYIVRALLAAEWSLDRFCPPPMPFLDLCGAMADERIVPSIEFLLHEKLNGSEGSLVRHQEALDEWIYESIDVLPERIKAVGTFSKPTWDKMDAAFHRVAGF